MILDNYIERICDYKDQGSWNCCYNYESNMFLYVVIKNELQNKGIRDDNFLYVNGENDSFLKFW